LGRGIVIERIGNKKYRKGIKTRLRYPSMQGGYIYHTFISKKCAEDYAKKITRWARKRAKIVPTKRKKRR